MEDKQSSSESETENYIIKTKMCKRLSNEFGLSEINYDEKIDFCPPKEHGLINSNVIIPSYYQLHKHPSKILDIDFYEIIKHDIRNLRPLNEIQLKYIKELPSEEKNELFDIFNICILAINDIMKS